MLREIGEQDPDGNIPGAVSFHKTRAHATQADVEAGRTTFREKVGNSTADSWAKKGALLHPTPARFEQALRLGARRARHITRLVARIGAEAAWGKFRDSTLKRPPRKRRADDEVRRRPGRAKKAKLFRDMLGRVGERQGALQGASSQHRLWRSAVDHPSGGTLLWCSACGAYTRELAGKPQQLLGLCPGRPLSKWKTIELGRLRTGIHPAFTPKARLRTGAPSRLPLSRPLPVPAELLESQWGKKRSAEDEAAPVRRLKIENAGPRLTLADWCKQVGLTARDFAYDDQRQNLKRKRRVRGKNQQRMPVMKTTNEHDMKAMNVHGARFHDKWSASGG